MNIIEETKKDIESKNKQVDKYERKADKAYSRGNYERFREAMEQVDIVHTELLKYQLDLHNKTGDVREKMGELELQVSQLQVTQASNIMRAKRNGEQVLAPNTEVQIALEEQLGVVAQEYATMMGTYNMAQRYAHNAGKKLDKLREVAGMHGDIHETKIRELKKVPYLARE